MWSSKTLYLTAANIRPTADILNYCQSKANEQALIAMLDFEKAFDSVKWSFLYQYLKAFNFGSPSFPGLKPYIPT